ncbi:ATP-binding protein [Kitasatospora sp. NPDC127116]|uniref:ATP-binding protein n=1 Tax=Kitasatospora sp. NPDC127116 TaxID=3345367 RepID=UPI00364450B2
MTEAARHRRQMACMVELTQQTAGDFRQIGRLAARIWHVPKPTTDAALVILSEYAANAWQHSGSEEVALRLSTSGSLLSVAVRDFGAWHTKQASHPEWWHEGGRGLAVVRRLAQETGGSAGCHHPRSGGTIAWAHLCLRTRTTT